MLEDNKMENNLHTTAPNYEAMYDQTSRELEKMRCECHYLRDELRMKAEEVKWLNGFRAAVETIFRKEN